MTIRRKLTVVLLVIALLPVVALLGIEYGIETGELVESEGLAHADAALGTGHLHPVDIAAVISRDPIALEGTTLEIVNSKI